jgi:site-specific DNA-methyltransferase (cytosine-N4-specific)
MRPAWEVSGVRAYQGDAREQLRGLPAAAAQMCVTSPPYSGALRDYGHARQLGQEATVELYVRHLVEVMREVRRVLRPDGSLWLNLGDSYGSGALKARGKKTSRGRGGSSSLRAKNLIGVPWRVALALQDDGWWLRNDIIWRKPNATPESVTDRFTRSHEHVFLLTASSRYFFDADAVREPAGPAKTRGR